MRSLVLMVFTLFGFTALAHAGDKRPAVYTDMTVAADMNTVWEDWTTVAGLESHFAPKAIVDLRPGGAYEVWFLPDAPKGQRGAEDGVILGYQPDSADGTRMIQFTWKMPPYMPEINAHMTVVQLWFDQIAENETQLRLYHTGFGNTAKWNEAMAYFSKSWPLVFTQYKTHIDTETP